MAGVVNEGSAVPMFSSADKGKGKAKEPDAMVFEESIDEEAEKAKVSRVDLFVAVTLSRIFRSSKECAKE